MTNTPAYRQQWILDLLKSEPNVSYVDMWAKYGQKWAKGKTTFDKDWKQAQEDLKEYQKKAQREKERVSIEIEKEAVKKGLKTKIDRLLVLQRQVDKIQQELDLGCCDDIKIVKGEPKKINRPLLPLEKSAMRRTIKELQSEISKIEGDYAPNKQEVDMKGVNVDKIRVEIINPDEDE